MKVVLQRVKSASVSVDGKLISSIGKGVLAFAAVSKNDTMEDALKSASKLLKVRLWDDFEDGKEKRWQKSVQDVGGEILCVSQFTLLASTKKARPSFHASAEPAKGKELYTAFFKRVQELYEADKVKDGIFQAMMDVALINDGPVTLEIDTDPPPLDLPKDPSSTSFKGKVNLEDLGEELKKFSAEFKLPAELLE
ncbi:putative aminoacyl-tRNA hydrolase [Microthyrium microscopicum]|uniref:D-aminoacyl-tRNA deacylase n=1 Tax=Microthyrium microscopicum TaxID=703497 RepID=A0A6A6TZQ4_9PEZI|nr:putative aminoacyl-tRNA hydrolase [Microthyrium microscopicum]